MTLKDGLSAVVTVLSFLSALYFMIISMKSENQTHATLYARYATILAILSVTFALI